MKTRSAKNVVFWYTALERKRKNRNLKYKESRMKKKVRRAMRETKGTQNKTITVEGACSQTSVENVAGRLAFWVEERTCVAGERENE